MPNFKVCRHLFTDGHQCGSPALRGELLCFNHHSARRPLHHQTIHGHTRIALPEPLDLHAIQRGLAELLRLTAAQAIDLPLAAALHRQLATASHNLVRIERSDARAQACNPGRQSVTAYTNHPTLGTIALEPGPIHDSATVQYPPSVQNPSDLQTQPPSNEDLETASPTENNPAAAPGRAPETEAQTGAPAEDPLPDPVHRFTLPPEIENVQSKEELAAAERHYAQALETLARGIHARAQTRAQLHATLYPLVDDTEADNRLLDIHPQLHAIVANLPNQPQP